MKRFQRTILKAGAMASSIRNETSKIEELILDTEDVDIANYNCPGRLLLQV